MSNKKQPNPKKQSFKQSVGTHAENLARDYLLKQGLTFLKHQYRMPLGEIDLIMLDNDEIVFIEVRYRKNTFYEDPEDSITWYKQQSIIRTAKFFQHCYDWTKDYYLRFDIVAISGDQLNYKYNWIPNAFGVESFN